MRRKNERKIKHALASKLSKQKKRREQLDRFVKEAAPPQDPIAPPPRKEMVNQASQTDPVRFLDDVDNHRNWFVDDFDDIISTGSGEQQQHLRRQEEPVCIFFIIILGELGCLALGRPGAI